eukprot:gene20009-22743_t
MEHFSGSTDPAVVSLDSSARVLLTTVTHKLLPALASAKAVVDQEGAPGNVNWGDALNHYASAAKQMDHLWQEVQPLGRGGTTETGFDMKIVTPVDSGHPTAEQLQQHQQMLQQGKLAKGASVFVGVQIPPLLSTMIPVEEAKNMHTPNLQYALHDPAEEAELLAQIEAHNQNMSSAVDNFNQLMEQWRVEKDSKAKVKPGLA